MRQCRIHMLALC
ncbi:unnamed protein product, partial [Linum tenue]